MKQLTFQRKLTFWFVGSVVIVLLIYSGLTFYHLRHELRIEQWRRAQGETDIAYLHGSYSQSEVIDITKELFEIAALYALIACVGTMGIGHALAKRSLKPVRQLNAQLQGIQSAQSRPLININEADPEFATLAENLNRMLGRLSRNYHAMAEFSATVAHEMRTPLMLLRLQVEAASDRIDPELAEGLQEEMGRLQRLVDRCLLMAKAERAALPVKLEWISLNNFLKVETEPFAMLLSDEAHGVTMEIPGAQEVRVDAAILRHILQNLLGNAVTHGRGNVQLGWEVKPDGAVLRINNPIRRAPSTGSGLGLPIVRALVELLPGWRFQTCEEAGHFRAEIFLPQACLRTD